MLFGIPPLCSAGYAGPFGEQNKSALTPSATEVRLLRDEDSDITTKRCVREGGTASAKGTQSRSQIYCEALREYVARHSPDDVTDALNRAMERIGKTEDKFVTMASRRALARVEW